MVLTASLHAKRPTHPDFDRNSYILTFSRKKGLKTIGTLLDKETNCPNYGAVLDLDDYGVCAYCHTEVSNGSFGWGLIDMKIFNC